MDRLPDENTDNIEYNLFTTAPIDAESAIQMAYNNKLTTSVSNYLKTDTKYYDEIIPKFADALPMFIGDDLKYAMDIFKR